jgi:hypothetical protein
MMPSGDQLPYDKLVDQLVNQAITLALREAPMPFDPTGRLRPDDSGQGPTTTDKNDDES